MLVFPFLISSTLMAQEAKVTPLLSKDITEFPGKEGLMIAVDYPPGCSDPVHHHSAHAFLYVEEIYYPGAPHGITATYPDQVNADLLAFLEKGRKSSKAA